MTVEQLDRIMEASRPLPYLVAGGMPPSSPQERANAAWAALGAELGFEPMTAQPIDGEGPECFSAIPKERP